MSLKWLAANDQILITNVQIFVSSFFLVLNVRCRIICYVKSVIHSPTVTMKVFFFDMFGYYGVFTN